MTPRRFGVLLATGFGLGLSPVAPGTVGALLGILPAAAMAPLTWPWQALLSLALAAAAVPVCDAAEREYGTKDDHRIVADEYLTFPLCLIGLPWTSHLWILPMAFVVNRVLDIVKPAPARQLQAVRGGLGIVIDDVISTLYALGMNHLATWMVLR